MNRFMLLTALGLLGLTGCIHQLALTPLVPTDTRTSHGAAAEPPPVRAEQITPDNAQRMSQALAEELDREAQRGITPTAALPK